MEKQNIIPDQGDIEDTFTKAAADGDVGFDIDKVTKEDSNEQKITTDTDFS